MKSAEREAPALGRGGRRGPPAALGACAEPELVAAARSGSVEAFGELYRRRRNFVRAVLCARLAPDEADDELQEVFLIAWERIGGLREANGLGPWLAAIARRRCSRWRRRRDVDPVRRPQALQDCVVDPRPAAAELDERAAQVLAEIRRLPAGLAEVLQLALVEQHAPAEIARLLGRSPGAVRVALHRGLRRLRARLVEDER